MTLRTFSAFYYGHEITINNNLLNFDEGGDELTAELNVGAYTLEEFAQEIKRAMDAAGGLTYTVSVNRTNRKITIASTATFSLLPQTGSQSGNAPWELIGFPLTSDKTGASTYTSDNGSGSEYLNQFIIQDHIDPDHWIQFVDASVNKTADGQVEVVTFGQEQFLQMNLMYITNYTQDGSIIKTNGTGVSDALALMNYLIKKAPVEFIKDISDRTVYENVILESTPDNQKGTGFKLKEMYDKGLPGYYQTGILKFRVYEL